MSRRKRSIEEALQAMIDMDTAQYFMNDPRHGDATLAVIQGQIRGLRRRMNDDPVLAAYQIRDTLQTINAEIGHLERWCAAVIHTYPDDAKPYGARLCRSQMLEKDSLRTA